MNYFFIEKKGKEDLCEDQETEPEDLAGREKSTNNGIKSGRSQGGVGRYRAQLLGIYAQHVSSFERRSMWLYVRKASLQQLYTNG